MPKITFLPQNVTVDVEVGTTLLEAAHHHDLPLEGACEGSLACSTCHVILPAKWYHKLEEASEEEEDILEKAFGLTPTSRLGCQILVTEEMDGMEVTIPEYSLNVRLKGSR
ncbi:MAG: 2Fe-2S iron-sulfur cluster binding domain-containing protein [Magnetococcales bacterium]|nr:2Fe-2S iron-sulfur cluster binding domain-containing protein [Magnetococcales bacterium]NGZ28336.1 2Fe-2S iron-sulfur cluster binding domain-containing protein [Magnetococcales bacterium]